MVKRFPAVAGLMVMCVAGTAFGHGLEMFATGDGKTISGKVSYDDDAPADHVSIEVTNDAGEVLTTVETDHDGGFRFEALGAFDHHLETETIDGHHAHFTVSAAELGGGAAEAADDHDHEHAAPAAGADIEAIIARQLRPLREQLNAYENSVRIRDIFGGIGYIVGVLGIIAWFKARRQPPLS